MTARVGTRQGVAGLALALALSLGWGCAQVRRIGAPRDEGARSDDREERTEEGSTRAGSEGKPRPGPGGLPAEDGRPPVPASPQGLVTDATSRLVAERLRNRGYLDERPRGELDAAVSDALRRFQKDEKLAATGFPDQETLRRLDIDPKQAYRTDEAETKGKGPAN